MLHFVNLNTSGKQLLYLTATVAFKNLNSVDRIFLCDDPCLFHFTVLTGWSF
jgi:hypothetical protein